MPRFMEFEDKELDKAIKKACDTLKISKQKLKYDVLSFGSTGIFGLVGVKKAKIRVAVPDKAPAKLKMEPVADEKSIPVETEPILKSPKKETKADALPDIAEQLLEQVQQVEADEANADENDIEYTSEEPEPNGEDAADFHLDEQAELGAEALDKISSFITSDVVIQKEICDERICYKVEGGNPAILIGKRGQTLEAIQYLVGKIVNKKHDRRIRIQVDVEGYLKNKRTNLISLAERLAQKARQSGKPVTVNQMNAHDRRIIHLALKNNHHVKTQSVGDGFYRKLVILPKKKGTLSKKTNKTFQDETIDASVLEE